MSRPARPVDVDALNAAFTGALYGDAAMTADSFDAHVRTNAIDLTRSLRWEEHGRLAGVALLGFRERRAWLGGFGVVPALRGRGYARRYVDEALAICAANGAHTIELEVMVRNAPAVALYARAGFAAVGELIFWARPPLERPVPVPAAIVRGSRDIASYVRVPAACWQREPASVAAAAAFDVLVAGDPATPDGYAIFAAATNRTVLLDAGARDRSSATRLLDAVDARVPDRPLTLVNEPCSGPLHEALQLRPAWHPAIRQQRMVRSLTAG